MAFFTHAALAVNIPTPDPGVYRWWFTEDDAKKLLVPFNGSITLNNLQSMTMNGKLFYAMYVGVSPTSLLGRYNWHISQKHTISAVNSGFLSTLRRSISALLQKDCTESEKQVTDMLMRCIFEWDVTPNFKQVESTELQTNLYPLNVQENKVMSANDLKILKGLRQKHKK